MTRFQQSVKFPTLPPPQFRSRFYAFSNAAVFVGKRHRTPPTSFVATPATAGPKEGERGGGQGERERKEGKREGGDG